MRVVLPEQMETDRVVESTENQRKFEPLYVFCRDRILEKNFEKVHLFMHDPDIFKALKENTAHFYGISSFERDVVLFFLKKSGSKLSLLKKETG